MMLRGNQCLAAFLDRKSEVDRLYVGPIFSAARLPHCIGKLGGIVRGGDQAGMRSAKNHKAEQGEFFHDRSMTTCRLDCNWGRAKYASTLL